MNKVLTGIGWGIVVILVAVGAGGGIAFVILVSTGFFNPLIR